MAHRLTFERHRLGGRLFGLPFLAFGLMPLVIQQTHDEASIPWALVAVPMILFTSGGFLLIAFRRVVTLDAERRQVGTGWGLVVPWVRRHTRFEEVREVLVAYEATSGSRTQHHGYTTSIISRRGGRDERTILIRMVPLVRARALAEVATRLIGCRLHVEGIDGRVGTEDLDRPVTERERKDVVPRSHGRVTVVQGDDQLDLRTRAPGLTGAQWFYLHLVGLLIAAGVFAALWLASPPSSVLERWRAEELAIIRWIPLVLGASLVPLVLSGGVVRATSRWSVAASPTRLSVERRAIGFGRRHFELAAREIEAVVIARDTEASRHGPHEAVLCVADTQVVALGHGLDRKELAALRDGIIAGLRLGVSHPE